MRNILFTVLFIGILSLIASPISLASKSLHKANMINLSNNAIICMHQDRMAICGSGLTTDLTYTTEKIRMYIVSN